MRQALRLDHPPLRGRLAAAPIAAFALIATVAAVLTGGSQRAAAGPTTLERELVASVTNPVNAVTAPGEPELLFVVQQQGKVQVLRDGVDLPGAFVDMRDRVLFGGEQGLLSMAFDPNYTQNRRAYLYYVTEGGDIAVSQIRRSAGSATNADESTLRRLITIPHPVNANHNGGHVAFGPDGHLYITTGDGGSGCDPGENAQHKGSLLGKLLRIDPVAGGEYAIPPDNPFVDAPGRDEIWSYGLRNPFRFSIDTALGTVAIGDVGQDQREEVDLVTLADARGANFGWDRFEGMIEAQCGTPPRPGTTFPMHDYPNPPTLGAAVTGGVIVRDPELPSLAGRYVFADFFESPVYSFVPDLANNEADDLSDTGLRIGRAVAFVEGAGAQLYVVSLTGRVYAIEQSGP